MGPVHLDRDGQHLRRELGDVLSEKLGREVVVAAMSSYAELASVMSRGEAALGWMSPALFVRSEPGSRTRLLLAIERSRGEGYRGVLFVADSAPATSVSDLAGKRVAWVDRDSSSGHLFVRLAMRERGLDPAGFFAEERFVGSHASAVRAVIDGEADCAATHAHTKPGTDDVVLAGWQPYAAQHAMRPILVSPPIPPDVICVSAGLDAELVGAIERTLRTLHDTHADLVDEVFSGPRLVSASGADYDPVRAAMQ